MKKKVVCVSFMFRPAIKPASNHLVSPLWKSSDVAVMIQISPDSFSSPINSSYPVMGLVKPLKSSKDCEEWSWVFLPIAPRQSPLIKDQQGQKKELWDVETNQNDLHNNLGMRKV